MIIKNINKKDIEIYFDKVTQIGISDIKLANEMYHYICKYFSDSKYTEEDLEKYNYFYPEIEVDGAIISRIAYRCIGINSYKDIDDYLKLSKDSILTNYNKNILNEMDFKIELENLEKQYLLLQRKISETYKLTNMITMEDVIINEDELFSKYFSVKVNKHIDIFEKIKQFLFILDNLSKIKTQPVIIYMNNVEAYLTLDELNEIKEVITKMNNIYLIIASGKSEYLNLNYLEKINFLSNSYIEYLPPLETVIEKVILCLKGNSKVDTEEIKAFLQRNMIKIASKNSDFGNYDKLIFEALISIPKYNLNVKYELENCIII